MRDVAILLLEMIGAVFLFLLFWYFLLCFAYPQCTRGHTSWTVKFVRFSSLSSIGVRLSDVFYRLYALIRPPWKANKFLRSGSESRKVLNWVICKERDRRVQGRTRRERNEADDPIQSFRPYVPLYTEGIWFWDKFIICMKTKCLVQVICHIGSFIGRNIAAFFWKKCYLHGTKSARNLVADIVVSEFSVDLSSSFSAAFSVGSFDIGIFVIWISSKWDICESPLCDIILLYHKTVQKHTYYF